MTGYEVRWLMILRAVGCSLVAMRACQLSSTLTNLRKLLVRHGTAVRLNILVRRYAPKTLGTANVLLDTVLKSARGLVFLGRPGPLSDDTDLELSPSLRACLDSLLKTLRFAVDSGAGGWS